MTDKSTTNVEACILALLRLGGDARTVSTEDLAKMAWEMFPDRFSWNKYQYPDKERVRQAMTDARRAKDGHPRLVAGHSSVASMETGKEGWRLTLAGVEHLKSNEERIASSIGDGIQKTVNRKSKFGLERSVHATVAFKKFSMGEEVMDFEFCEVLRCSLDAGSDVMSKRLEGLRIRAASSGSSSVSAFLEAMSQKFSCLLQSR